MTEIKTKQCIGKNGCGLFKPESEFYFHKEHNDFYKTCKMCCKLVREERKNATKIITEENITIGYKKCLDKEGAGCGLIKLATDFYDNKNICKNCCSEKQKENYKINKKEINEKIEKDII